MNEESTGNASAMKLQMLTSFERENLSIASERSLNFSCAFNFELTILSTQTFSMTNHTSASLHTLSVGVGIPTNNSKYNQEIFFDIRINISVRQFYNKIFMQRLFAFFSSLRERFGSIHNSFK